jgi:2-polyprenyl-3-methyl-5-hydroxy-6-metoxy-1,4-benzoquinol methylase
MDFDYTCVLCNGKKGKKIPFGYAFKDRELWGIKCNSCGLITIQPQPSADEITEMYAEQYFTVADKKTHHGEQDYISATAHVDHSEIIGFFRNYVKKGNFLEIGCATGSLLVQLRDSGFNVTGVEISEFAAKTGREKYGLEIINSSFTNELIGKELPLNHFDAIYLGDVLEHFTNPIEALENMNKILKKGGYVFVDVPSTLNLISSRLAFFYYRLSGKKMTMTLPPYHLTEFFPASLRKAFKRTGFDTTIIKQQCKHPKTIPLRHSFIENTAKLLMQYPNYFLTRYFGILGDRMTGIGRK